MYQRINHYRFYYSGKAIEIMSSIFVLDYFLTQIKIPNGNEMPKLSFNVGYYYMFYYL